MKKHYILTLLVAMVSFFGFTSCGDDSVDPTPYVDPELEKQLFTVTALAEDTWIWFSLDDDFFHYETDASLMYSYDGVTWKDYVFDSSLFISKQGDAIYFKAGSLDNPNKKNKDLTKYSDEVGENDFEDDNHISLCSSNNIAVSGNILSLLYGDNPGNKFLDDTEGIFTNLFRGCEYLKSAEHLVLPTNTKRYCYKYMFRACTALTSPPLLRATKMTEGCYLGIFQRCLNLQHSPQLPAKELAPSCYEGLFCDCYSLKEAPALPATKLTPDCYSGMFSGCESLTEAPELPAKELADRCYEEMFAGCKNLFRVPLVAATSITKTRACQGAFSRCWKLGEVTLKATSVTEEAIRDLLYLSGNDHSTLYIPKGMASNAILKAQIPSGWTVIEQ